MATKTFTVTKQRVSYVPPKGYTGAKDVRHLIEARQITTEFMDLIFTRAHKFRELVRNKQPLDVELNTLDPIISLFNEPSTRTRFSFEAAAKRLGFQVITTEAGKVFSSAAKGESIEDTAANIAGYHPAAVFARFSDTGDALRMANYLPVPLLNGGDGKGEHPTQSLLDMFTISEHKGRLSDLRVVMGGDMANGRTVRSLAQLLSLYEGNEITFVSPKELKIDDDIKDILSDRGVKFGETDDMHKALPKADVVYWTRLQAERFKSSDPSQKEAMHKKKLAMIAEQPKFCIGTDEMKLMKKDAILMHPLPRVKPGFVDAEGDKLEPELTTDIDSDPRAKYFDQSENGMYVRMALLEWALQV